MADWLASRQGGPRRKAQKAEEVAGVRPIPRPKPSGAAERLSKVTAGLSEIELWLRDLIRNGLAVAQQQPPGFWESPGLADDPLPEPASRECCAR